MGMEESVKRIRSILIHKEPDIVVVNEVLSCDKIVLLTA